MTTGASEDGRSTRLALAFSCLGHSYSHLFAPIFYVAVLALEPEYGLSHGEAVALIVFGNVLYGLGAPVAGWLGDRWSAVGMMAVFFFGTGGGMIATGLAGDPGQIALGLAATGLFAAIYHPVGIAWLVRNARAWGRALGINGVFGGIGPAAAALGAGALIDLSGWRAAFVVPGVIVVATGGIFCALLARGTIVDREQDARPTPEPARGDLVRAFVVLSVTMLCSGLIYQASQPALPKLFSLRLGSDALGVAWLVALVYVTSGAVQVLSGWLADRVSMKTLYLASFALQVPFLLLAAALDGGPLVLAVMLMVSFNVGGLPAENGLVARWSPRDRRGLAFGAKFVLAFGVSGLGVQLEGWLYDLTGDFHRLFVLLGSVAAVGCAAAWLLPSERREVAARALLSAPAE